MFEKLPNTPEELFRWEWADIEPFYAELAKIELTEAGVESWLANWTRVSKRVVDLFRRLSVATSVNTADQNAAERFNNFFDNIYPQAMAAEQKLKDQLLVSGLRPEGFDIPLRNMRSDAELFREENLPLLGQDQKYCKEYDKIAGAQTVEFEGQELTPAQVRPIYQDVDRTRREKAWRLVAERQLADRTALSALWARMVQLRAQIAANAGLSNYRQYRWKQLYRFDYTPDDCETFQRSIEEVVVPAALRIYERRRQRLGLKALRPWDLNVDPFNREPLRPYQSIEELKAKTSAIFHKVDDELGGYFDVMVREDLLDLENRKNKAPGGYCTDFSIPHRPFIFMNAVGLHDDVQTLLHEGGHAFHTFEMANLPYLPQMDITMEIAEVASMSMELLSSPYLTKDQGGFYSPEDANRARVEHLEEAILFWPYMAVVDGFQHWAHTHAADAVDPAQCDAVWADLWARFMKGVDWSGLEDVLVTGWQRKLHIFLDPFYYVEYGLAQLGAGQVWRNAMQDRVTAIRAYRKMLSLGCTMPLPQLYQAAGARLGFDVPLMQEVVSLMEKAVEEYE